jgi:hypothetical protein
MLYILMPDTTVECLTCKASKRRDDLERADPGAAIAADSVHALSQR